MKCNVLPEPIDASIEAQKGDILRSRIAELEIEIKKIQDENKRLRQAVSLKQS